MPLDFAPLLAEIAKPEYAELLSPRNDSEIWRVYNAPNPDIRVPRGDIPVDELLSDFTQEIEAILSSQDAVKQAKWIAILQYMIYPRKTVTMDGPTALGLMTKMADDGFICDRWYVMADDPLLGSIRVPAKEGDSGAFKRSVKEQIDGERTRIGSPSERDYGRSTTLDEVSDMLNAGGVNGTA